MVEKMKNRTITMSENDWKKFDEFKRQLRFKGDAQMLRHLVYFKQDATWKER